MFIQSLLAKCSIAPICFWGHSSFTQLSVSTTTGFFFEPPIVFLIVSADLQQGQPEGCLITLRKASACNSLGKLIIAFPLST